jgi:hypothetical protein
VKAPDRLVLAPVVRRVLEAAHTGKGSLPHYLTAYQILERLREPERANLINQHGRGGKGAGRADTGPGIIAEVLNNELLGELDIVYFDACDTRFIVAEQLVEAGYPVIALYRLRHREDPDL